MKYHSSVIFVRDIEISKDFYTRVMGLDIQHDFGKNVIFSCGIAIWEISADHVISQKTDTLYTSNRFELYFESAELDEKFSTLKNYGIDFLHDIKEEPWGQRTIRFYDPDHHLLEIGEPLEVFVRNMYQKGMTAQQIAEKSGIPHESVISLLKTD